MKILLINKYLYPRGGDAIMALATGELLKRYGHQIEYWGMAQPENAKFNLSEYFVDSVDFEKSPRIFDKLRISSNLLYSFDARNKLAKVIGIFKPDIVHLHNFAHQISPSILHELAKYKIPMVMTMHDYKLVCAAYSMLAKDKPCMACKGRRYYRCFLKSCVKDSRAKSALNTLEMYFHHRILRIYNLIDVFISPSIFLKNMVEEMGFMGEIKYLPNFVQPEVFQPEFSCKMNTIVYFGRLSKEKGLLTLINAMVDLPGISLKIIGKGPIEDILRLRVASRKLDNVHFLGHKIGEDLNYEIRNSMFVVVPSECYENNPRSIIESFALGKPVLGARIGGIPELVHDNETGLTFEPGNTQDLCLKVKALFDNQEIVQIMGRKARLFVERELHDKVHYSQLIDLYSDVIKQKGHR